MSCCTRSPSSGAGGRLRTCGACAPRSAEGPLPSSPSSALVMADARSEAPVTSEYVPPTEQLVTEIVVRDVRRSTAFHLRLGFRLHRDGGDFVELNWDDHLGRRDGNGAGTRGLLAQSAAWVWRSFNPGERHHVLSPSPRSRGTQHL